MKKRRPLRCTLLPITTLWGMAAGEIGGREKSMMVADSGIR